MKKYALSTTSSRPQYFCALQINQNQNNAQEDKMTSLNLEPIRIVRCFDILIMLQNILNAILKHPKIRLKIFCKLLKRNLKLIIGQHSMSNWLCTLTGFRRK